MRIHILLSLLLLLACSPMIQAQEKKISVKAFEGTVVAGYVDHGAFINCTGPAVKFNKPNYSLQLGLLPSIKIKEDHSAVKNALFTPSLGFGATLVVFQHLALQAPTYYVPKTATSNGKWTIGLGIGYKL